MNWWGAVIQPSFFVKYQKSIYESMKLSDKLCIKGAVGHFLIEGDDGKYLGADDKGGQF